MRISVSRKMRRLCFGISSDEATFSKRAFRLTDNQTVDCLERVGQIFIHGYNASLSARSIAELEETLEATDIAFRGFAYEGAAMGLALLDNLSFRGGNNISAFLKSKAAAHIYMVHVGIGWALARLPWTRRYILRSISKLDPLLKWLAVDGFGFHEGYFYPRKYFHSNISLDWLPNYSRRAFTQGLGRSLWFVEGGSVMHIAETISRLPKNLHADLWSGIGLACAYAGGVSGDKIEELRNVAQNYLPHLAQGVAFAAKTRQLAGNPSLHTEKASRIICGLSSEEVSLITDMTLEKLTPNEIQGMPPYEIWRQRIQFELSLV